ncbi:MAG TPA: hypothetical protein VK919_00445 [Solirubrobacterales bacterium]|nr:hypothetical protein [Solirubrobacterales bacterium]
MSDWDLKVFRDSDGDGSSVGEADLVGSSGAAPTTSEETTFTPPPAGGEYVARVINYAAVSPYEGTVTFAKTESSGIRLRRERWTLTCRRRAAGKVAARRKLHVARGGSVRVDLRRACRR